MDVKQYMQTVGSQARAASRIVARADTNAKNKALLAMADAIMRDQDKLLAANAKDMGQAKASGLDAALLDIWRSTLRAWRVWPKACARSRNGPTP